jgi:hypothetical protein
MVDLRMDVLSFSMLAQTKRGPKRLNVVDMRVGRAMDKMTRRRRGVAPGLHAKSRTQWAFWEAARRLRDVTEKRKFTVMCGE